MTRIEARNVNMVPKVSRDLMQAETHLQRNKYDDTIRICRRYVDPETKAEVPETNPNNVGFACYLLGQVVIKKGREAAADRAIQFYDRSIELYPMAHTHSLRAAAFNFRYRNLWEAFKQESSPQTVDQIIDALERSEGDLIQAGALGKRDEPQNTDFLRNVTEKLKDVWRERQHWQDVRSRMPQPSSTSAS